jgi:hypothetical protein
MAENVRNAFGFGSPNSIRTILLEEGWSEKSIRQVPLLSTAHMKARLDWANDWHDLKWAHPDTLYVHIDEKWFYATRKGRMLRAPPDYDVLPEPVTNKTKPEQVMFLAAVAPPRHDFDGRVGIWPIGEWRPVKRRSKYYSVGDERFESCTMDADYLYELLTKVCSIFASCFTHAIFG